MQQKTLKIEIISKTSCFKDILQIIKRFF